MDHLCPPEGRSLVVTTSKPIGYKYVNTDGILCKARMMVKTNPAV